MAMTADEFLRRFLLHVLPRGFVRTRQFWLLCAPAAESVHSCLAPVVGAGHPSTASPTQAATSPTSRGRARAVAAT